MAERRILETTQLLGALPPDTLETLRQQATMRTVARNEVLFRQGDAVVASCSASSTDASRSSPVRPTVASRSSPCSTKARCSASSACSTTVRARPTPARSRRRNVLVLGYDAVRAAIDAHPTMLWVIVRLLARRLRNTDESLADAVFLDVPARTAKRLLEIAGDADQFRLPMTQEDLAGLVGASRERVNKALSLFTRLGWIEVEGRNRYRILDRQALHERATL